MICSLRDIETNVNMRIYTLSKRQFASIMIIFFLSFSINLFMGFFGPSVMNLTEESFHSSTLTSTDQHDHMIGNFKFNSPSLSPFHQQLWLTAVIHRKNSSVNLKFSDNIIVKFRIESAFVTSHSEEKNSKNSKIVPKETKRSDYIKSDDHGNFIGLEFGQKSSFQSIRTLNCFNLICNEIVIMHINYIEAVYYLVELQLYTNTSQLGTFLNLENVNFMFKTYNPSFTQFEIWFRFTFLIIVFLVTLAFSHSLRKFRFVDWSIEQKWLSLLLPLLLLYDNPFLPLNFLMNGWVPVVIDSFLQATFYCALLMFWLCIYHGVRHSKRSFVSFYLPKLVIVFSIWLSALSLSVWQAINEAHDLTFYYRLNSTSFWAFKILFLSFGGIYCLYLLFVMIRAFAELRGLVYFNIRLKFLTFLMSVVLICSVLFTGLRFGVNVFGFSFVTQVSTNYYNSWEFCAMYGLLNNYLFLMAFVYSPAKNSRHENHFKDNPTISMLNDSDEDVVYGSDVEETALMTESRNWN